jgi:hypothetical protein
LFQEFNWTEVFQVNEDADGADFFDSVIFFINLVNGNVGIKDSCETVLFFAQGDSEDSFELKLSATQEEIFFESIVMPEFDDEIFREFGFDLTGSSLKVA